MQVGVDQDYAQFSQFTIHIEFTREAMGLAVNIHSSSRVSKHSGIPSLNVCMNCHKVLLRLVILQRLQNILKLL
jgi:hypothetical protein